MRRGGPCALDKRQLPDRRPDPLCYHHTGKMGGVQKMETTASLSEMSDWGVLGHQMQPRGGMRDDSPQP